MRKETIDALIKAFSTPPEECVPMIVRGYDQFGNEITERILVPKNNEGAWRGILNDRNKKQ